MTSQTSGRHVRLFADIVAGHDDLDSTTVNDKYTPFTISDEPSIAGLKIGIPRVRCSFPCESCTRFFLSVEL